MFDKDAFLSRIRDRRKELKLTQYALAEALNVAKSTYNQYENGNREFSINQLPVLCDTLTCDISWLMGEENAKEPAPASMLDASTPTEGYILNLLDGYMGKFDKQTKRRILAWVNAKFGE